RGVAAVELEVDARGEQGGDLGDDAALVGLGPAGGHREVHTVGVGLEQGCAASGELAAQKLEDGTAAAPDLGGGVGGREPGQGRGGAVGVGGVDGGLHRRGLGGGGVARGGAGGRGGTAGLGGGGVLDEPIDEGE